MTGKVRQAAQRLLSLYRIMGIFGLGYLTGGVVVAAFMVGGTTALLAICQ